MTERPYDVFISYRTTPDAAVARAFKRLLEATLEPKPMVFVASEGGIRPSSIPYYEQLQRQATEAKYFVGIVTSSSKEQPWMFFEAGAAWGRRMPYTPLLVDTSPSELSSTITPYQAVRAAEKTEVRRLVDAIGECCGATLKRRFSVSFKVFERTLNRPQEEDEDIVLSDDESGDDEVSKLVDEILKLHGEGEHDAADKAQATGCERLDDDDCARLLTLVIWGRKDLTGDDKLSELDRLESEVRETALFHLIAAKVARETMPYRAIAHWESLWKLTPTKRERSHCLGEMIRLHALLGREKDALELATTHLFGSDHGLRRAAASWICNLAEEEMDPEILLLRTVGVTEGNGASWSDAWEVANKLKVQPLMAYLSQRWDQMQGDDVSAYCLGRACFGLKLPSLAWRALNRSAERGSEIAIALRARLFAQHPVPAAGLEAMDAHAGHYSDAAYKAFPHGVRADLERSLDGEKGEFKKLCQRGERQFLALRELAGEALEAGAASNTLTEGIYRSAETTAEVIIEGTRVSLRLNSADEGQVAELAGDRTSLFRVVKDDNGKLERVFAPTGVDQLGVVEFGDADTPSRITLQKQTDG